MNLTKFGNPVPENISDLQELIDHASIFEIPLTYVIRYKYPTEDSNGYFVVASDEETGDEMFTSYKFLSKSDASLAFSEAGVHVLVDATVFPDNISEFFESVPKLVDTLSEYSWAEAEINDYITHSNDLRKSANKSLVVIWNMFTALKNEMDAEHMMSWPTFHYADFEVDKDEVTITGRGFKNNEPQDRYLTIPLDAFAGGPEDIEDFLKALCESDRAAFERDEINKAYGPLVTRLLGAAFPPIDGRAYDDGVDAITNMFGIPFGNLHSALDDGVVGDGVDPELTKRDIIDGWVNGLSPDQIDTLTDCIISK